MPVAIKRASETSESAWKGCVEPAAAARRNREIGLDTSWFGLANSYTCPRGVEPGDCWLLLPKLTLDELLGADEVSQPLYFDVKFFSTAQNVGIGGGATTETATIKSLVFLEAECVTPGFRDDQSAYLCRLQDKRVILQRHNDFINVNHSYNVRHLHTGAYLRATLRPFSATGSGSPWTWQEMLDDVWPPADPGESEGILGPPPTLPWTPAINTPEDLVFEGMSDGEALEMALALINCELAYNPLTGVCTYVLAGQIDSQFEAALEALDARRVWDGYKRRALKARTPSQVKVAFRRRGLWRNHDSPINRADDGIDGGSGPGEFGYWRFRNPRFPLVPFPEAERRWPQTVAVFYADLELDFDVSTRNIPFAHNGGDLLRARTEELGPLVFASLEAAARGVHVVCPFALSETRLLPGPQVSLVRWAETGAGVAPFSGMTTEVRGNRPVKSRPPQNRTSLDPFHARVVIVDSLTTDAYGYYPGKVHQYIDYPAGPGNHYTDPLHFTDCKLYRLGGAVPVVGEPYIGVYQSKHRYGAALSPDPHVGVWAFRP